MEQGNEKRTGATDINAILQNALPEDVLRAKFEQRFGTKRSDDPTMRPITVTWEEYQQRIQKPDGPTRPQFTREDLLSKFRQAIIEVAAGKQLQFDGNLTDAYLACFEHLISGSPKGLWICGDVGTGKSFMARCLVKFSQSVSGQQHGLQHSDVGHYYTADGIGSRDKEGLVLGHRIIDDFAASTQCTEFGKWVEPLEAVLWERHRHFETAAKKTWFVSNVTLEYYIEVLNAQGKERLASRISQIIEKQVIIKANNKRNGKNCY